MPWYLQVETKTTEHKIRLSDDQAEAVAALSDARSKMEQSGVVLIRDTLAIRADDIVSIKLGRSQSY